jgi:carboxypeptidase C (cathepsin A)
MSEVTEQKTAEKPTQTPAVEAPAEPVVRQHSITVNGTELAYTTTTGLMPIKNDKGEIKANLFYVAYTKDGVEDTGNRPLTIVFNGGPGSSTVWLHMGGVAPKRVEMLPNGGMPKPPFKLVDNEYTWLVETDLVFVDPVDTGFSRATSEEAAKEAKGVEGDIATVGEFIRMYLVRNARWSSPLFLAGESYGTFRSAGLAGYLIDRGVAFSGIILISSILNMQTARFTLGNDLPHQLFLPTYAATAWYHNMVDKNLKKKSIREFLDEVEAWVEGEYVQALSLGDRISEKHAAAIADALVKYTGLPMEYVRASNLRIEIHQFCKALKRSERQHVGRLDSRFTSWDKDVVDDVPEFDPSMNGIIPPFTSVLNPYFRQELGYESDVEYHIIRGLGQQWDWGSSAKGYSDTSDSLRSALAKNPYMKVFVASGYYDLATPYYATEYTLSHMNLAPEARQNIRVKEYPTGHMVYIDFEQLVALSEHCRQFIRDAVAP